MNNSNAYTNTSQQLLISITRELAHLPLEPRSIEDLMAATGASRDKVFRTLKNLEAGDWAVQLSGGGWRLAPNISRISERMRLAVANLHHQYLELSDA